MFLLPLVYSLPVLCGKKAGTRQVLISARADSKLRYMTFTYSGTVIQGGMTRVAVDLTEIICRRYESNKRNKQRTGTYTYQITKLHYTC